MTILQARNLEKSRRGRRVVQDLSFEVAAGEIVGLLGRLGAGKSTTLDMLVGAVMPDRGQILFHNEDVAALPMQRRIRMGMGHLAQQTSLFQRLNAYDNLMAFLETHPLSRDQRRARAEELLTQFDLARLRDREARTLALTPRRKLDLARAMIGEPSLILLDEPFSGLDPNGIEDFQQQLGRLRRERGVAMLVTDHHVEQALGIVDRAYVIESSQLIAELSGGGHSGVGSGPRAS